MAASMAAAATRKRKADTWTHEERMRLTRAHRANPSASVKTLYVQPSVNESPRPLPLTCTVLQGPVRPNPQ